MRKNNSCLIQYIISFRSSCEQRMSFLNNSRRKFQSTKGKIAIVYTNIVRSLKQNIRFQNTARETKQRKLITSTIYSINVL